MGIVEARAQRRIMRNDAVKANNEKRIGRAILSSIPSLMSFKGNTGTGSGICTSTGTCAGTSIGTGTGTS